MASTFADRLKAYRKAANLTQGQLAKKVGCRPLTVSKIERGYRKPSWEMVQRLSRALGLSCEDFRTEG